MRFRPFKKSATVQDKGLWLSEKKCCKKDCKTPPKCTKSSSRKFAEIEEEPNPFSEMSGTQQQQVTVQEVKSAIDVLYKGTDPNKKDEASRWLEQFQLSMHAWELSSHLLHMNPDTETSYFAAQTMRTKIQYHFFELPINIHNELKNSLLQHLANFQKGPKSIVTQLCLALADLAAQSPQWQNPVNDMISRFSSAVEDLPVLLEILAYLPEEIESSHLKLGMNRRDEFYGILQRSSETVLQLLVHCQKNCPADEKVQVKIYYCFGSWLELGSFPPDVIANSDLLKSVFETLLVPTTSTTLHDAVTDCICSALYISDTSRQQALAESCFNFVMALLPAYEKSVQDGDIDRAINYARLFTEMGCSLLNDLLKTPGQGPGSFKTVEMLLTFLDHPEYEVGDITFRFWYRFAEALYKGCKDEILNLFRPYVQILIMKVCRKCQLDSDHEGLADSSDDFQEFRVRAIEVVQDTVFIVGYTTCFLEILRDTCTQGAGWNKIEAGMFIMQSIANKVKQREEQNVGEAVKLIVNLPQNAHIALKFTAVHLLAELTPWLDVNTGHIDGVFQFILNGLQDKELVTPSAVAFEYLCVECKTKLTDRFPVILQVVNAIDSLALPPEKSDSLLRGAAHVLSCLPYDKIKNGLTQVCMPQVTKLNKILQGQQQVDKKARGSADPTIPIDRLSAIFRNTNAEIPAGKEHPCQSVIEELWPLLSNVASKFKHDERVMERTCRCLRFAIRCVGSGFRNLLQPFVEQMITIYYQHQHSCFLYLGSVLVDEYGHQPNCAQGLIEMLKAFSGPTFTLLSVKDGLVQHPDTIDDFFRLCIRLLQKCPIPFLENESMEAVMQLATAATVLNHREAHASTIKFLVDLIHCGGNDPPTGDQHRRNTLVTGLVNQHGSAIIKGLMNATAGKVQTYMVPDIADVFWEFICQYREPTSNWFKDALNSLPTHSPTGVAYATPEQLGNFYETVIRATSKRELWRVFREFCRFYQ